MQLVSIMPETTIQASTAPRSLPRTRGLPFVGVLPRMFTSPLALLKEAREKHGDIFALDVGVMNMIALTHPRHAQHVFKDNARNYRKGGTLWESMRILLGNGLPVSEGDFWLRQRRLMQPAFHRQRLAGMAELMTRAGAEELDSWERDCNPLQPGDANAMFAELTMRVITKTMFACDLDPGEREEMGPLLTHVLDSLFVNMFTRALPKWLPVPGQRSFLRSVARIDALVRKVISRRRASGSDAPDLLGMLLGLVDADTGEGMTDQQLVDETMAFFLAGYETTAATLAWAFVQLDRHPEVMARLRAEVDGALGVRDPTFADLPRLGFTRNVIQETLRLCPPVWFLPRTAIADDTIDGFAIPAGTTVTTFVHTIHHHPDCWERPEEFVPERFAADPGGRHPLAWMPFGAGPRICIGKETALMEATLLLAMIIQRFDVSPVLKSRVVPDVATTLRPKGNVLLIRPRRPARGLLASP